MSQPDSLGKVLEKITGYMIGKDGDLEDWSYEHGRLILSASEIAAIQRHLETMALEGRIDELQQLLVRLPLNFDQTDKLMNRIDGLKAALTGKAGDAAN